MSNDKLREFSEWLDTYRDLPVHEVFHEIVLRYEEALATTEPEFNQEPFIGDPVLVVEREPDYWDRGHFHEGTKPDIKCTKIWGVPIGTKLYTEDQMKSYGEQCWKAGYDLGKSRSE